jgi:hypothetical protein
MKDFYRLHTRANPGPNRRETRQYLAGKPVQVELHPSVLRQIQTVTLLRKNWGTNWAKQMCRAFRSTWNGVTVVDDPVSVVDTRVVQEERRRARNRAKRSRRVRSS